MIKIERRTLFDIIDGYNRASSNTVNTNRNYRTYNPYLRPAQWAASQWATAQIVTNDMNRTITNIEPDDEYSNRRSYIISSESLLRQLGLSPEPDTVSAIIDDYAPQTEITEQELLDFLNGKDDVDANR